MNKMMLLCALLTSLFLFSACDNSIEDSSLANDSSSIIENSSVEAPDVGSMGTSGLLSIKETYVLGEEFSVPACYVEVDGADVKMPHTVYYPDGRTSGYDTVTLDALGTYRVVYTYEDKEEEVSFRVGAADIDSLFTSVSNAKITANTNGQDWNDYEMNGVEVYVVGATGAEVEGTFRYNEIISLRGKTKDDAFIEFIGNSEGDTYAYGTVTLTLTDAYNPDNYIVIEVRDGAHLAGDECGHVSYVTAQANDMYAKMGYNQNRGIMHEHGTEIEASASGKRYKKRTMTNSIRLSYDTNENALYGNVGPEANTPIKVLDFDDKNMVDERYLWNGFSADMVYMSVTIKTRFQSDEGRILITSLNGTSMSGKKSEVNDIRFDIDSLGYSKDALPNGLVGATYPAFNAKAYDNYGRELGEASLKVLDPDGFSVSCVNGRFRTDKEGDYTLIYSYETQTETGIFADTETLTVSVEEKTVEIACTILNPISQDTVYKIGDKIVLSDCNVVGNIGNATVMPVVTLDGVPVETVTYQGQEFFYVDGVGDYAIAYVATDFLGNTVTVKDRFNVAQNNVPVIELPEIGKIAVKGNTVEVPLVNAYTYYRGGKQSVPVKVYFNGEEITDVMSFMPDSVGSFELKYVAEYNGATTTESVLVEVVERTEETPFIEGYMYLDGFEATYTDGDYYLETTAESASAQFALPIKQNFLSVTLSAATWDFDNLYVTFTDSVNPSEKVELRFATYVLGGKVAMALWINGVLASGIEDFGDDVESTRLREISLCYDPETKELNDGRGKIMGKITTNYEGVSFNGFGSGYAYVDILVDGATPKTDEIVGSLLKILKISEHTVSSNTEDRTPPSFILANDFGTLFTVKKGDTFKVKDVWAYDVFSKKCTLNLQILAPDGTAVYNGGYVRGYSFTAEQLGQYTVIYTALDANNRKATKMVKVSVQEFGMPKMTVDAPASTANVGDKVTFAEAEYDEENVSVYVYVVRPNGARVTIEPNAEREGALEYTYLEAGTHYIRYVAVDEFMNVYVKEFAVEVK